MRGSYNSPLRFANWRLLITDLIAFAPTLFDTQQRSDLSQFKRHHVSLFRSTWRNWLSLTAPAAFSRALAFRPHRLSPALDPFEKPEWDESCDGQHPCGACPPPASICILHRQGLSFVRVIVSLPPNRRRRGHFPSAQIARVSFSPGPGGSLKAMDNGYLSEALGRRSLADASAVTLARLQKVSPRCSPPARLCAQVRSFGARLMPSRLEQTPRHATEHRRECHPASPVATKRLDAGHLPPLPWSSPQLPCLCSSPLAADHACHPFAA